MKSLISIIKADYLQRARSYAFLITLLASIGLSYTFLPAPEASYSTVRVGEYVGYNNSAWVGHVTAIMASTFLWLIGFYLVNNGIRRDIQTGVGQIIATTSISNFKYLLAKTLSNFFVLLTILFIVIIMSFSLMLIRGSDYPLNISQFLLPYLLVTTPTIFIVSAVAVFTEVIFGKYTVLQNITFFVLFSVLVGSINARDHSNLNWMDILGTKELTDELTSVVNTKHTDAKRVVSVGFIIGGIEKKKFFLFEGTDWRSGYMLLRLGWIVIAVLLIYFASRLFNRFDSRELNFVKKKKPLIIDDVEKPVLREIHLPDLPVAQPALGILPFIKTEFLMLIRKGPKWFWLINIGGFIALFFMPLQEAHKIGLPVLWFLQVNRWADISTREKYYGTHYFTYAAFRPLQRLLTSQILSAWMLAILLALPLILRSELSNIIPIVLGALFVVAFAVCSGIITGGKRFFEIVYFMLVYSNLSAVPYADYFGAFNQGMNYNLILVSITGIMLLAAYAARAYEIRNQ